MTPLPPHFAAQNFLNRELSLLAFNRRVLAQAEDDTVPLLERLRFLCIVSSNLDEFFEIRVAGLKERNKADSRLLSLDGLTPAQAFGQVAQKAHELVAAQYRLFNEELLPKMQMENIVFLRRALWSEKQRQWIRSFFFQELMPVLTPIGLDPSHPFPRVLNKSLNFAVELEGKDAFGRSANMAIVQAPRILPRVIRLPADIADAEYTFVFLSSILHEFVGELFAGMTILGCYQFRVTRNSDLFIDEEEAINLRTCLQGELSHRHFGDAVRLEIADNCSQTMREFLLAQFNLGADDVYQVAGPVNLVRLMQVPDWVDRTDLKFSAFVQGVPLGMSKLVGGKNGGKPFDAAALFARIRKGDVLLHHPYQTFAPVIELLRTVATDPAVVAVKMTVYRTGTDSVLMEALIRAAKAGKEVTVIVELMARFDEEANIGWATKLEEAGAHVVYGVLGYKTHAKALFIVRRENNGLCAYAHLGTGNYHPRTARLYSDFGLITANPEITGDVNEIFKQLTGLGKARPLQRLWQSPFSLHRNVLAAIDNEITAAKRGEKARIIAKMNALLEAEVIAKLYQASAAGVEIDLIVRGACALRPGVKGLSENIRVRSIIGRFLEHHRVLYFYAGGEEKVFLSSADWMDRNFFRRIELAFPLLNSRLKKRVINEGLLFYLSDSCGAWQMNGDGEYERVSPQPRHKAHSAQGELMRTLGHRH